jgi:predicted outer membrane repeat protein
MPYQASAAGPARGTRMALPAPVSAPTAPLAATSAPGQSRALAAMSSATAAGELPEYGNPDGHAWVPAAGRAVSTAHPDHVIGLGTPAGCTSAAVVRTVAMGGIITFDCGPKPVTITMSATAKISAGNRIVIDGGGKVTLSGAGRIRILDMNTCPDCWEQSGPQLIVQNMSFADGYSGTRQTSAPDYGGGAIFDRGGQLTVVNSAFTDNRCYQYGPDLGGGAIRAYGMDMSTPVYLTDDTFTGNTCSNGGAVSGLYANFVVINSLLTGNAAIGWGQNPAQAGTPGGGSGGAIYTDGDTYSLIIAGTVISGNSAREGGGGIFCTINNDRGTLLIQYSHLHDNLSGQFQDAPGIFESRDGHDVQPVVTDSTIS